MHVIGLPEGKERENGAESNLNIKMAEMTPNLVEKLLD